MWLDRYKSNFVNSIKAADIRRKGKSAADGNDLPVSSVQPPKHIMTRENNVIWWTKEKAAVKLILLSTADTIVMMG